MWCPIFLFSPLIYPDSNGAQLDTILVHPIRKTPTARAKAFPDAIKVRHKGNRHRWESKKRIYEWDYQHGKVEIYDKQGNHLGEYDPDTGKKTGDAKP